MSELSFNTIHEFEKMTNKVSIATTEANGNTYCCIREMGKKGDSWIPTFKGITFPKEQIAGVIEAVEKAIDIDPYPKEGLVLSDQDRGVDILRVSVSTYRKTELLNIRKCYKKKDQTVVPSKVGITFPPDLLDDLLEGLNKVKVKVGV